MVSSFTAGEQVQRFLDLAEAEWNQAVNHRFVRELFAGKISDEVLGRYLVQDYQSFEAFLSMLGACVAHASSLSAKLRFSRQLGFLESDEDNYFVVAFEELQIAEKEYLEPELTSTTRRFRDLMYSAVDSADYVHLLIMLVIAEGLYLEWGERKDLPISNSLRKIHLGWIELHRGSDFKEWVEFLSSELEQELERHGSEPAHEERWRQAVHHELMFFEEPY